MLASFRSVCLHTHKWSPALRAEAAPAAMARQSARSEVDARLASVEINLTDGTRPRVERKAGRLSTRIGE